MLDWLKSLEFASPWPFWFLLLPLASFIYFLIRRSSYFPNIKMPDNAVLLGRNSWRGLLKEWFPPILRFFTLIFLILAIARPQQKYQEKKISTEGIDIMLAVDVSISMLANDFEPTRLDVVKDVAAKFIEKRPYDQIGLVIFAGESFLQCPLTTDHPELKRRLGSVEEGFLKDGTAIGMGLSRSINVLRETETKSKVVILLTDGVNNQGSIDPLTAAKAAEALGIKVYTIGAGSNSAQSYIKKYNGYVQNQIQEDLLEEISVMTGGQYFRATNEEGLQEIYDAIDKMEKTKIDSKVILKDTEEFLPFALIAAGLFALEILLRYTILKSIP